MKEKFPQSLDFLMEADFRSKKWLIIFFSVVLGIQAILVAILVVLGPSVQRQLEPIQLCPEVPYSRYEDMKQPCKHLMVNNRTQHIWRGLMRNVGAANCPISVKADPILTTEDYPDDLFDDSIEYRVTILQLHGNRGLDYIPEDVSSVISNSTMDADAFCTDDCDPLRLLKMRVLEVADYLVEVEFTNIHKFSNYISSLEFEVSILNRRFTRNMVSINIVLFVLSIILTILYELNLRRVKDRQFRTFEQRGLRIINYLLILFYEPVSIIQFVKPSLFAYIWSTFWDALFLSGLIYFLMVMSSRIVAEYYEINTQQHRVAFGVVALLNFAFYLTTSAVLASKQIYDPTFSMPQEYPWTFVVFSLVQTIIFLLFGLHVIICFVWFGCTYQNKPKRHFCSAIQIMAFLIILICMQAFKQFDNEVASYTLNLAMILIFIGMCTLNYLYSYSSLLPSQKTVLGDEPLQKKRSTGVFPSGELQLVNKSGQRLSVRIDGISDPANCQPGTKSDPPSAEQRELNPQPNKSPTLEN